MSEPINHTPRKLYLKNLVVLFFSPGGFWGSNSKPQFKSSHSINMEH